MKARRPPKRWVLYIRVDKDRHRRIAAAAERWGGSINELVENWADQWLIQTDPTYEVPEYLEEQVASGRLKKAK